MQQMLRRLKADYENLTKFEMRSNMFPFLSSVQDDQDTEESYCLAASRCRLRYLELKQQDIKHRREMNSTECENIHRTILEQMESEKKELEKAVHELQSRLSLDPKKGVLDALDNDSKSYKKTCTKVSQEKKQLEELLPMIQDLEKSVQREEERLNRLQEEENDAEMELQKRREESKAAIQLFNDLKSEMQQVTDNIEALNKQTTSNKLLIESEIKKYGLEAARLNALRQRLSKSI